MIDLDDPTEIKRVDQGNLANLIERFPEQLQEGLGIGQKATLPRWTFSGISHVVVAGLGGSAIAAELVNSYLNYSLGIPSSIVRHYLLPHYVNQKSLIICSSYSGNTEETLSAYLEAKKRKAKIIAIASGGRLEELCKKDNNPLILIPQGFPPRAALGYSFVTLLILFGRLGLVRDQSRQIRQAASFLKEIRSSFLPEVEQSNNPAKALAGQIYGRLPIIYASQDYFYPVALRWKQQICENAKVLAFCNAFSEFNHNELVGWGKVDFLKEKVLAVILKDREDHKKIQSRMKIVRQILESRNVTVLEVESSGATLLSRILSLVHLGDWTSFYLAVLNQVDPTPVEVIDFLKDSLARAK